MTQHNMLSLVQEQLAIDLNCSVSDLNGEKDSLVFVAYKETKAADHFLVAATTLKCCQWVIPSSYLQRLIL